MMYINKIFNFKDKIVLITGSSGQLGTALSNLYLELGAKVYGIDIKENKLKHKNFFFFKKNINQETVQKKIIEKIFKIEKKIDILINNASISVYNNLEKRKSRELDKIYEINLKTIINLTKQFFIFYKKYNSKSSNIINLGSIYGFLSPDFKIYSNGERFSSEIYGATKAGVIQLTKYFAVYFSKYNIRVNCISPGGIRNRKKQSIKFKNTYSKRVPMRRMAEEKDLLTSFLYLSSDYSSYVTGQNIVIDGGLSLK